MSLSPTELGRGRHRYSSLDTHMEEDRVSLSHRAGSGKTQILLTDWPRSWSPTDSNVWPRERRQVSCVCDVVCVVRFLS